MTNNSLHWKWPATFLQLNVPFSEILPPFALIYFLWFAWLYSVLFFLRVVILLLHIIFIHRYYLSHSNLIYLFIYCYHFCCNSKMQGQSYILWILFCICCTITGSFSGSKYITMTFSFITDVKCQNSPLAPPVGEQLLLVY